MLQQDQQNGRRHPFVAKGLAFPFQATAACWLDLLGYGVSISAAKFNPVRIEAQTAVARLHSFHETVAAHSHKLYPTLVLNDGAVAYRDRSLRSRSVTFDFLARSFRLFARLSANEAAANLPGARMIIASGFRIRRRRIRQDSEHLESILERFSKNKINPRQAIQEASRSRPFSEIIPELQANFAFTKSYVADCDGKEAGFVGPGLYMDKLFFSSIPPWLSVGKIVDWNNKRLALSGDFLKVVDLQDWQHPEGGPLEVRDGLELAQMLSEDANVITKLRSAKRT